MTPTDSPLLGYEERLLAALQYEIAAHSDRRQPTPNPPRRNTLLLAGVAAVIAVAAGTVAPLLAGHHGANPAFAVTTSADGTVTATIYRFKDATGLQTQLADAGIDAIVQYAPPGKICQRPTYTDLQDTLPRGALSIGLGGGAHYNQTSITASPSALHGLTLVATLVETGGPTAPTETLSNGDQLVPSTEYSLDVGVTHDTVGPCALVNNPGPFASAPK